MALTDLRFFLFRTHHRHHFISVFLPFFLLFKPETKLMEIGFRKSRNIWKPQITISRRGYELLNTPRTKMLSSKKIKPTRSKISRKITWKLSKNVFYVLNGKKEKCCSTRIYRKAINIITHNNLALKSHIFKNIPRLYSETMYTVQSTSDETFIYILNICVLAVSLLSSTTSTHVFCTTAALCVPRSL